MYKIVFLHFGVRTFTCSPMHSPLILARDAASTLGTKSRASVTVMVTCVCMKDSSNIQSGCREGKVNLEGGSREKKKKHKVLSHVCAVCVNISPLGPPRAST